ncbi:frataxin homolog, mitochondrial-like [Xenia sp. Carnegie-2017]|uniref:frataxin homolog, mitochondrial-like n=1 Tax=Xenia sp. Carnegie-2017 TaxID=2897299 RepID=UPI001F04370C|nr:frataxin homolog, mitochondrial-like [Xenia sp. Carnegie-2017]
MDTRTCKFKMASVSSRRALNRSISEMWCKSVFFRGFFERSRSKLWHRTFQIFMAGTCKLRSNMQWIDGDLLFNSGRYYCTTKLRKLDEIAFHAISDETLHALMEYFEELGEDGHFDQDYDIEYADGVLTIRLGGTHGTYVINKQTPNRQIWLSSPTSGPKRYDFSTSNTWIYRHTGVTLHELLSKELSKIIGQSVYFTQLQYGS